MRERTVVRTTCPRDCYDACGMTVVLEAGSIRSIRGDSDHTMSRGSLCGKCSLAYNGAWIDPAQRLLHPLRRVGAKGTAHFETVSWDDALSDIARRLRAILAAGAAETIIHTHYTGICSAIAGNFPIRFFRRIGATEVDPDTVCNKAGHEALKYVLGDSLAGFDPRTVKDANCVVIWGANPSASAPHVHKHWLPEAAARKIVIDPIAHATARVADLFLQLRPGTDAALAFAMMHAAQEADALDRDFIAAHVLGWEAIADDVNATTPERGEELTGVPAALIRQAAELYAQGPSLLWLGQGMQRQRKGGNAFRAVAALCAVTGNIGRPGTGLLYMNGPATRGADMDYVTAAHLAHAAPPPISHMDLADRLADAARARALFTWNNNIVASNPQQNRLREALKREDLLHVAIDLFATDTTDYADYVLPAASFLELNDVLFPYFEEAVSAVVKVREPMGSSLPNQEIFRRLGARMGLNDPELFESDEAIIDKLLRDVGWDQGFSALAERGTFYPSAESRIQFAGGVFPTPSGKIEIVSARAAHDGHPQAPVPHADEPAAEGRLRVLSPASEWTMNSSYANDGKVRDQLGRTIVLLNPAEADRRRIGDGQIVELYNGTGRLSLTAKLSDSVPRGVALVHKGRWPKLDPTNANVNVLNPGEKSDIGESTCVHGVEADIRLLSAAE
jgi:anaerobic selenocysteine-containing dehydrogenase